MTEALLLLVVVGVAVVMAAWIVLTARSTTKPEAPNLDTRGPDDR